MTRRKTTFSVFILLFTVFLATARANTLSDTYYQVFTNPHNFDGYLNDQVVLNQSYYSNFNSCLSLSSGIIDQIENQLNGQYQNCPNNSVCTQIAQDIQLVRSLRVNLQNLSAFIHSTVNNPNARFLNSRSGRDAILLYNNTTGMGIPLPRVPAFIKQINTLNSIPCP